MENKDYNGYSESTQESTDYSPYYNTENYNYGNAESYSNTNNYGSTENYNYNNSSQNYTNGQNGYQYNNQQFTNLSGVKVDSEGRPMQNLFAVQLIFAIVEIVLCCFSPTTMVLAIIALVFAIQANTAYAHNKEVDFKVKSKVSNILLIIGGVFTVVSIISSILFSAVFMASAETIVQEFEQEYGGDVEAFLEDLMGEMEEYDDGDEYEGYSETLGDGDVPLAEGFDTFTLNGITYSVPMTYNEFLQMGYTIEEGYENYILEADTYENLIINGDNGYMIGMIRVSNDSNVVLPLEECVVDYIRLDNDAAYYDDVEPLDLTFGNGLTVNSSYEEVEAFMGEPTYLYIDEETEYENYTWYYYGENEYQSFDIYFSEGVISEICFEQYEYVD